MTAHPWRVWLAFEVRPGITRSALRQKHWRELQDSCRRADGKIDQAEFNRWFDLLVAYGNARADA